MNINRFFGISLACDIIPIPYPLCVVGRVKIKSIGFEEQLTKKLDIS